MAILVLGGAGYIGSHMVDRLIAAGKEEVVVVDNLVTGHRAAVHPQAVFYEGDLADKDFMRDVFAKHPSIDAVIHFAAFSLVAESMADPLKYFDNNTAGMVSLLEVMQECGVKNIVFSSTAATYGIPEEVPILETTPQKPINPYGESKLMMETIMRWADQAYGIKFVALRYFKWLRANVRRLPSLAMITILQTAPMSEIMSILSTWLTLIFWLLSICVQDSLQMPLTLALRLVFPTCRL